MRTLLLGLLATTIISVSLFGIGSMFSTIVFHTNLIGSGIIPTTLLGALIACFSAFALTFVFYIGGVIETLFKLN
jgi:hypothetical protein